MKPHRAGAAILALALLIACSGPADDTTTTPSATTTASAAPSMSRPVSPRASQHASPVAEGYREITLDLGRGIERDGRDYGSGKIGVVLTHMGRPGDSRKDWAAFAEELAGTGYRVVTFNHDAQFVWRQVLAAADHLRDDGVESVIAIGASHGAMASLRAAQEPGNGLVAVVWIAGVRSGSGYAFAEEDVAAVACPILFASGTDDEYGAAEDAESLSEWAPAGELVLVESSLHGTDILLEGGAPADELRAAILDFLDRATDQPAERCG